MKIHELGRRITTTFAVGLSAGLALTACGSSDQPAAEDSAPVVRLQGLEGGLSSMALKIITDQGFDEANGFTAETFEVSGDASVQFFLQGDADVSFDGDPLTAALLRSQGNDVTTYFPMAVQDVALVVRGDSPYQTEQDLIGQKVGHDGLDSGGMTAALVMLEEFSDLDIEEQYDLQLTQEAALLRLLDRGDVEAVFTAEPNTIIAAQEYGMRTVWGPGWQEWETAAGGRSWNITAMARDSWIDENPELAAGVQNAWNDAYDWIVEDPSRVTSGELGDLIGIENEQVATGFEELIATSEYFTKRWTEEDVAAAEAFIEEAAAAGLGGLTSAPAGAVTRLPESGSGE
ncbi:MULTISPECIES: ABC transporter substrate-binding protein [Mycobacteriaceae]|uniref:ABC transporter substrate-binding protein n=1 Tax=Mycolicibacterium parafortuitum TaxID=39692 RepID=A0ACC6MKC0_MYCPF|nr:MULTISPECIES: ABC transporter substrate-binding protein [Mycobacteriaceae]MDZ5087404.1 ABC transporter substrate-binding protein [Mycolicibacterium parafortuitum]GFM18067.1 ABC-type nitrate/sulfonate/bicarbonate transport system, substrate binding protein [Mycobacterium sp. PO1]GFM23944.1 ABC-type nitrate/sulfonate/bicarbonate transport system, substrate binding protein [Mycobacterium sp. PO2]